LVYNKIRKIKIKIEPPWANDFNTFFSGTTELLKNILSEIFLE
jgi:hypothetical protein